MHLLNFVLEKAEYYSILLTAIIYKENGSTKKVGNPQKAIYLFLITEFM